ncbi:MAG: endo-beta-N-acetylglucosaminidase, partial [Bacteroidaceae bacterium]|nr:endo-beta-N-acetylglucosaminidase [Bacteroidaceae bacterium]
MLNKRLFLAGLGAMVLTASAQEFKEGYVEWGYGGTEFGDKVAAWKKGTPISDDDNFFISRVKPRERFRNQNTQVRSEINESNDKKLLLWVPINSTKNNALPDGVYDSEVFNMWPYVTHYGNWTAPLGRVPGNFLDVAHKNGVAVSGVAGIPYGSLMSYPDWEKCLETMVETGAEKVADFHNYYGVDGLGYNSEFGQGAYIQSILIPFHQELVKAARQKNPLFENVWYDGTNDNGMITFDQGLGSHNDETFGAAGEEAAALFLNYNWNRSGLLDKSVSYAQEIGRNPLDLYAGMNMQGAE